MTSENAAVTAGGGAPEAARRPLRELMDDRLLDALLERSRDQAGGLRLTGEGSMLGELIRAVLGAAAGGAAAKDSGHRRRSRRAAGSSYFRAWLPAMAPTGEPAAETSNSEALPSRHQDPLLRGTQKVTRQL